MQGFNPPLLIDVYRSDPRARFVFLHEFGDGVPYDYSWQHAGCDTDALPAYVCICGDDPDYDAKWARMQPLLTRSLNSLPTFACRVEVIDARNSSAVPGYSRAAANHNRFENQPCSGMYPQIGNAGWAWEMQGVVTSALRVAVLKAQDKGSRTSKALKDFQAAIDIALEN